MGKADLSYPILLGSVGTLLLITRQLKIKKEKKYRHVISEHQSLGKRELCNSPSSHLRVEPPTLILALFMYRLEHTRPNSCSGKKAGSLSQLHRQAKWPAIKYATRYFLNIIPFSREITKRRTELSAWQWCGNLSLQLRWLGRRKTLLRLEKKTTNSHYLESSQYGRTKSHLGVLTAQSALAGWSSASFLWWTTYNPGKLGQTGKEELSPRFSSSNIAGWLAIPPMLLSRDQVSFSICFDTK